MDEKQTQERSETQKRLIEQFERQQKSTPLSRWIECKSFLATVLQEEGFTERMPGPRTHTVTLRITDRCNTLLQRLAREIGESKTATAEEILMRAIFEAADALPDWYAYAEDHPEDERSRDVLETEKRILENEGMLKSLKSSKSSKTE